MMLPLHTAGALAAPALRAALMTIFFVAFVVIVTVAAVAFGLAAAVVWTMAHTTHPGILYGFRDALDRNREPR